MALLTVAEVAERLGVNASRVRQLILAGRLKAEPDHLLLVAHDGWRNIKDDGWKSLDAALVNGTLAAVWAKTPDTARRVRQRIEKVCQLVRDGQPLPAELLERLKARAKRITLSEGGSERLDLKLTESF